MITTGPSPNRITILPPPPPFSFKDQLAIPFHLNSEKGIQKPELIIQPPKQNEAPVAEDPTQRLKIQLAAYYKQIALNKYENYRRICVIVSKIDELITTGKIQLEGINGKRDSIDTKEALEVIKMQLIQAVIN